MDIDDKVNRIDKNVAVILAKQEYITDLLKNHDVRIIGLEQAKYTIYGVSLTLSGVFSIIIACLLQIGV